MCRSPPVHLTPRKTDVLRQVARRLPNRQIAAELVLAEHTGKSHVSSMLTKLDLRDRAEAVVATEGGCMEALERLRELCLAMPETTERLSHGEPTWFVRDKKVFVMFANQHHDDRVGLWCAAVPGVQESLVAEDPEHFFRPPYVGHRGWLGVYLDVEDVDWDHLEDLVESAYRQIAPKTLIAELDARG